MSTTVSPSISLGEASPSASSPPLAPLTIAPHHTLANVFLWLREKAYVVMHAQERPNLVCFHQCSEALSEAEATDYLSKQRVIYLDVSSHSHTFDKWSRSIQEAGFKNCHCSLRGRVIQMRDGAIYPVRVPNSTFVRREEYC